jgi:methylthioribulose 1-phosphate dehydratase/enolase-phosphatase E1
VWGADWVEAKTHAECYDYLFEAAVRMQQLGVDPSEAPATPIRRVGF